MDRNRIVAYSLLAHINDSEAGIRDLTDIFKPLVKHALSQLTVEGRLEGNLEDVKAKFDGLFSLDIPFPYLDQILRRLSKEFSTRSDVELTLFKDGSYVSTRFVFAEYEDFMAGQDAEVESIQSAFERYAASVGTVYKDPPSIFSFIEEYRLELIPFVSGSDTDATSPFDDTLASFMEAVMGDRRLFETFRRIYLGSVIASFLTLNIDGTSSEKLEILLDTNVIIGLIDLGTDVSYHTCTNLLDLCRKLGHQPRIMDITIEELENLLTNHSDYWHKNYYWQRHDPQSIYNACQRRRLTKTDLYNIAQSIPERLESLGISIIFNTKKYQNIARNSTEYEVEKKREANPEGALHDVTALKYVQRQRGRRVAAFARSKAWFVTHPRGKLYLRNPPDPGYLPEIITADDLLCMFWLSSPGVSVTEAVDPALSHILANAVSSTMPNARVLSEFGYNVEKYAKEHISVDDLARVSHAVADRTLKNLPKLNALADKDPSEFVTELEAAAHKLRETEESRAAEQARQITDLKEEMERQIVEQEERLKNQFKKELHSARERAAKEASAKAVAETQQKELKKRIEDLDVQISTLSSIRDGIDGRATKTTKGVMWAIVGAGIFLWIGAACLTLVFKWDVLEPIFVIMAFPVLYYAVLIAIFLLTDQEVTLKPKRMYDGLTQNLKQRYYEVFSEVVDGP